MFFAKPRLAISLVQWTQPKKTHPSAQRDKVRADVGVESDLIQAVIASRICFFRVAHSCAQ